MQSCVYSLVTYRNVCKDLGGWGRGGGERNVLELYTVERSFCLVLACRRSVDGVVHCRPKQRASDLFRLVSWVVMIFSSNLHGDVIYPRRDIDVIYTRRVIR